MSERQLTCAECDELFPDYFEDALDDARRLIVDAHASSCARCQGLIRDIRGITATAAALPHLAPSRDLWKGIEERIQPAVLPIGERRHGVHVSRRLLGIAAAALVVISSSVTYVATRGTTAIGKRPVRVSEAPRDVPARVPGENAAGSAAVEARAIPEATEIASSPSAPNVTRAVETQRVPAASGIAKRTSGTTLASARRTAAETAIAPEIEQLQSTLRQRREQLDPSTVKIVEDNLALIDAAVKQAREALMKDPASGFLSGQLDNALRKKVELLRTVASLPSRS